MDTGKRLLISPLLIMLMWIPALTGLSAQEVIRLNGTIRNKQTGTPLGDANIVSFPSKKGTTSDAKGTWQLATGPRDTSLIISHIGFYSDTIRIADGLRAHNIEILLTPEVRQIAPARIVGQAGTWNTRDLPPGQIRLSVSEVSRVPALFGEQDILNSLHSLPGIQSVGEGSGYFYVRGGNADQNLILLDDAVIYNPSHLLGIFSVINPSAIQSLSLYKSGIPACYGDRLASVIDLTSRDGDQDTYHGEVSLGLIASKIFFEGPVVKDKVSVLFAARRTWLDALTPLILGKSNIFHGSGYAFLDLNGKITWNASARSKTWLTLYGGSDRFRLKDSEFNLANQMTWGNRLISLNSWNTLPSGLEMRSSVNWSGYVLDFGQTYHDYAVILNTGLSNIKIKHEFLIRPTAKQLIRTGIELQQYRFNPYNAAAITGGTTLVEGDSLPYRAREAAIFLHHEWTPGPRLTLNTGIRLMLFQQRGPFDRFVNDWRGFPADTLHYPAGRTIASYFRAEPRISLSWQFLPGQTLKASATRQYQPVHMVPATTTTLPLDLWIPSTDLIAPQQGTTYSLGWFPDLEGAGLEGYIDGFYRHFANQVEFVEDQSILAFMKDNLDRQLTTGTGKAYGIEVYLRKKTGKTQGWIGYTWSEGWRTFPEINGGKPFHPRQDRTHDFNLVVMRSLNAKWDGSFQFVYATGQPVTVPISIYVMNGTIIQQYSERNAVRLPAYHRIDLAFSRKPGTAKKLQSTWTFSVYNLYNRLNPFFIYYDLQWDYEQNLISTRTRQIALLPLLPSVTWTGRF